jgi:hypothetical protein
MTPKSGNKKPRPNAWKPICLGVEIDYTDEGRRKLREGLEAEIRRKRAEKERVEEKAA